MNDASGSLLMTHVDKTEQAYVLIHGTTNSPRQWEELGNMRYDQGHNVLILRMPYHGLASHDVSELKALRAEAGAFVSAFEFYALKDIPHNSVDPSVDPAKKALVYAKILEMLGE